MATLMDIKEELVVFLRNADIISTTNRGVTTSQDTGTFSAASTHTLATNPTLAKNVRNIEVASTDLVFGDDYTVDYTTGVISFVADQTGAYVIDYDQGSADKVYPDFPQAFLKLSQFPRLAVDIITGTSNEFGIGADLTQSEYTVSIIAYDESQTNVENMISSVKTEIMDNKKNFFYLPFVTPTTAGPLLVTEFGQNKVVQRNQDLAVRFIFDN